MRLIVFFDLPTDTALQRKQYRLFRKSMIKDGFRMMQESVYSKLVIDKKGADKAMRELLKHKPSKGLVQVLQVTERQYADIKTIVGESQAPSVIDSTDRLIVL